VVADWEYRTAYIETFQIRIPARLHERLGEWAKQERGSLTDLVVAILEEAVRHRGAETGTDVPRDE
jgi:predicted HicB family RNase H-like nuclease